MKKHNALALLLAFVLAVGLSAPVPCPAAQEGFSDVPKSYWAYSDILELQKRGLVQGSGGAFRPEETITAEAFLSMVCRAAGLDDRTLDSGTDWSAPALAYGAYMGWYSGRDITADSRSRPITRELAAQLTVKALFPGERGGSVSFRDQGRISPARLPYVQAGVRLGLLNGYEDGRFAPQGTLTRAAAAAVLCRALHLVESQQAPAGKTVQVPILMYHDVSYLGRGYSKTPEVFRRQMQELKDAGFTTVTYAQLLDYVERGTPLPAKPLVLTLDDGYRTNYQYVFPILRELDMKAEISLVGGAMEYSDWGLKWDQVREMADSGLVSFQAHTNLMHEDLSASGGRTGVLRKSGETWPDYIQALRQDTCTILDLLEAKTGVRPIVFTYPMGKWNSMAEAVISGLGCPVTVTTREGIAAVTRNDPASLHLLPRVSMDFRDGKVLPLLAKFGYQA